MGWQLSTRYPTTLSALTRRRPATRRLRNLATVILCAAALSFCTSPSVASAFVRLVGSPLSEEQPTETHTWSEAQHRSGARLRVVAPCGRQLEADGPLRNDPADHVLAAGPRVVNARRLSCLSGFIASPATEMIRSGIQLRC